MIVWSRVDSRLVHGQVVEAWLPHLDVQRVVVADEAALADPMARAAYSLALPPEVELVLSGPEAVDFDSLAHDAVRTLVLFREVQAVVAARAHGLPDGTLNLGNVHAGPGRTAVSRSVFLDEADAATLESLARGGMRLLVQAVPRDPPVKYTR